MKLIVAGAPKTGTTSVAVALRRLGLVVCDSGEQTDLQRSSWRSILLRGSDPADLFPQMFAGFDAVTDGPAFYFVEPLLATFPDARVVLLTREEGAWADSYRRQKEVERKYRWLAVLSPKLWKIFQVADASERVSMGSDMFVGWLYKWKFRLHNDRVRAVVPKERLLEFRVDQGWAPLCEFLGVDVPDGPFPHENANAGDYERDFRTLRNRLLARAMAGGAVVAGVLFAATRLWAGRAK